MKNILYLILLINLTQGLSQTPIPFYPTTAASGSNFGSQIDLYNNEILVSSKSYMFAPINSVGKAYLFNLQGSNLEQTNTFYPSDALAADGFGNSISIENDFIAIGSPFHDTTAENSGAVYVYRKVNNEWQLFQKLTADDGKPNDNFGSYVKVHGSDIFISATGDDQDDLNSNTNNGSVYVYSFNGVKWNLSKKLTIGQSKGFGTKIEIENNTAVISGNGGFNTTTNFALHTYILNNTDWVFLNSIDLGNLEQNITDFSLSNNHIYVISNTLSSKGSVFELSDVAGYWSTSKTYSLLESDQIYNRIKVNNDKMFIGSMSYTLQIERKFPLLYYKKTGDNWIYQQSFYGLGNSGQDDYFGSSIASRGELLVVGAPKEGAVLPFGKAYYFDTTLGVEEFKTQSSSLYPNPTKNFVHIMNNSLNTIKKIEVSSVTGKILLTNYNELDYVSLENFPQGIYFLKLEYDNTYVETFKIIKN